MEIDERLDTVLEHVYRDMQVYCIAANAGAEMPKGFDGRAYAQQAGWFDGLEADLIAGSRSLSEAEGIAGWAAWYAAAEELP